MRHVCCDSSRSDANVVGVVLNISNIVLNSFFVCSQLFVDEIQLLIQLRNVVGDDIIQPFNFSLLPGVLLKDVCAVQGLLAANGCGEGEQEEEGAGPGGGHGALGLLAPVSCMPALSFYNL